MGQRSLADFATDRPDADGESESVSEPDSAADSAAESDASEDTTAPADDSEPVTDAPTPRTDARAHTPNEDGPNATVGGDRESQHPTGSPAAVTATAAWTPAGECPRCGESAERRFVDDGLFVCVECNDWAGTE